MTHYQIKKDSTFPRRLFFFLTSMILLFPLFRFITHRVPRKPIILEIHDPLTTGGFIIKKDFIIFSTEEETWSISRKCTHLGCRLNYKEKENILECPCHQSRFKRTGEVLRGPAKKPLTIYKTEKQQDSFTVTI